jgi:hypothetical protein
MALHLEGRVRFRLYLGLHQRKFPELHTFHFPHTCYKHCKFGWVRSIMRGNLPSKVYSVSLSQRTEASEVVPWILLGCDAVSTGEQLLMFRSHWNVWPLKALLSFEISLTLHLPIDAANHPTRLNIQQHSSGNLESRNRFVVLLDCFIRFNDHCSGQSKEKPTAAHNSSWMNANKTRFNFSSYG